VDRKVFAKISPEDQKIVRQTMGRTWQEIDQQNRTDNIEALKVLNKMGIEFVKPAPDDENDWFALAAGVTQRLLDSGAVSKKMVNALDSNLKAYRSLRSEKQ
jgi:TRAP-type C4-dicarboxylate transport system substrate-binding protein